ncbi:MAG: sigma-70 family RNA polymerase sigma factor [Pyrinomonadaceae bacterium]
MSNLKFPAFGEKRRAVVFFSKSITFDQGELNEVASATRSPAESEFIERLKAGDAQAFDTLVNRYTADIYALLFRLTQDVEEARDLTQETFLRALKAVKNFRGQADLKTWLYRIAVNESRNRFRWWTRRRREKTISLDSKTGFGETTVHETISASAENPETETLRRERQTALRRALSKLPENFREAIILRDIEGLSYEGVAAALETNIGTVKSRIARGRVELRKMLEGF